MKTVHEICELSGVSRRTLRYYDQIGLLPPSAVKDSGYRLYDDSSLHRLWRILLYRDLGLSLDDIRLVLDQLEDESQLLAHHRKLLKQKQTRLTRQIKSIDNILAGEFDVSMLRDFDKSKFEQAMQDYNVQRRARMDEDREFHKFLYPLAESKVINTNSITDKISMIMNIISVGFNDFYVSGTNMRIQFIKAMKIGLDSKETHEAVAMFAEFINVLKRCGAESLVQVGNSYLNHRNALDKFTPGLSTFVGKALIQEYGSE